MSCLFPSFCFRLPLLNRACLASSCCLFVLAAENVCLLSTCCGVPLLLLRSSIFCFLLSLLFHVFHLMMRSVFNHSIYVVLPLLSLSVSTSFQMLALFSTIQSM